MTLDQSIHKLEQFVIGQDFKGYDPYDTLLSPVPFKWLGKWGPVLAIQFQKRNPINIRALLGIKKEINPKAFGLFLQSYSRLYVATNNPEYLKLADKFFDWLSNNYSKGYSGKCWGYNFPWASPEKYMKSYIPSAVVTGFVFKGLFEYYQINKKKEVLDLMNSACQFLENDLEQYNDDTGLSISYTPLKKDVCYNASLLAGECLAKYSMLTGDEAKAAVAIQAVNFVVARQHENGMWKYSLNLETNQERHQIDFHQGYVLECIYEIQSALNIQNPEWELSLKKGLRFYIEEQFHKSGRSYWRLPRLFPVEIHNQAQGIITLLRLAEYHPDSLSFAKTIADWSIKHMQSSRGHFYYQKFKNYSHKIPYMRWSQAWMFLALTQLQHAKSK